jgi:ribosomal protein S18 acetylase RimI-like enzyme
MNLTNRVSALPRHPRPPARPPLPGLGVRFVTHRDWPMILGIERACFSNPLTEAQWCALLGDRRIVGAAAEVRGVGVLGHLLYRLYRVEVEVLRLAVDPRFCRRGVGTALLDYLTRCGGTSDRRAGYCVVSERLTPAHLFFRSRGWRAEGVVRRGGCDEEDLYEFTAEW